MKTLVLQGGGYKGAYQYGVLTEIEENFAEIFGTSVGALNALYIASGKNKLLNNIWADVINDGFKFHKSSGIKGVYEIIFKKRLGLYENNLSQKIREVLEEKILQIPFYVTVVDYYSGDCYYVKIYPDNYVNWYCLKNGELQLYMEQYLTWAQIAEIITASTCVPGFFKPIFINEMMLYDGGVRDISPLNGAVLTGATEVLLILCSPGTITENKNIDRLDKVLSRTLDIQTNEIANEDIRKFLEYNEIANKAPDFNKTLRIINIDIIKPEFHLLKNSLSPDKASLLNAFAHGQKHGKAYSLQHIRKYKMNDR